VNCLYLAISRSAWILYLFKASNLSLSLAYLSPSSNALFALSASISAYLSAAFSYNSLKR